MTVLDRLKFAFWGIATLALSSRAQDGGLFEWGFGLNEATTTSIPTCTPIPIVIYPLDPSTNPTPPFYMISFALDDTPVTTFIGTDLNNLTWTVTQPTGSQLALSVVDATGSPGGLAAQILTVIAGQTTDCVSVPPTPGFTVTANVTSPTGLTTCEPWGLTMQGGKPPYTVTLVQPDSPDFTNATLPASFDLFTYINRAYPGGQLIAAVSDSTGRWATGTPIVDTTGSTNISCGDLVSSGGSSANGNSTTSQHDAANPGEQARKKHRSLVIAVCIPLVLLALIVLGGALLYTWRRTRQSHGGLPQTWPPTTIEPKSSPINDDFDPVSLYSPSLPSQTEQTYSYVKLVHNSNHSLSSLSNPTPTIALSYHHERGNSWTTKSPHMYLNNASSFQSQEFIQNLPSSSTRLSTKPLPLLPNARKTSRLHDSEGPSSSIVVHRPLLSVANADEDPEAVFQHRDAGLVGIEIPPPYPNSNSHA